MAHKKLVFVAPYCPNGDLYTIEEIDGSFILNLFVDGRNMKAYRKPDTMETFPKFLWDKWDVIEYCLTRYVRVT